MIGDCHTAALVSRSGSIDWLCWPRFDSDACFAALLGTSDHGRWMIAPRDPNQRSRRGYRDGSVVLETIFTTAGRRGRADRLHAGGRPLFLGRAHRRGAARPGRDGDGTDAAVLLRRRCAVGDAAAARRRHLARSPGPNRAVLRTPVDLEGVGSADRRHVHGRRGRAGTVRADLLCRAISRRPSRSTRCARSPRPSGSGRRGPAAAPIRAPTATR